MTALRVKGQTRLAGSVAVSGSKYVALAVIPAALLADSPSIIENLPDISDVAVYADILRQLGAKVEYNHQGWMRIDPTGLNSYVADQNLVKRMRASYYLLGVLLARFGHAEVALPGGDDIGPRPIDQHLKGFRALGAEAVIEHGLVKVQAERLKGNRSIYLDVLTVGATINLMLAAVLAEGTTVISNAYRGPFIVDLANFLNAMGARVLGAGTETIRIQGVPELHGCEHTIIPDQSEAATLMAAAAMTKGNVTLRNTIPDHLESITAKLQEAGVDIEYCDDKIRVRCDQRVKAVNVKTQPLPGFFTDFQAPMSALLTTADGMSIVTETIWEERFEHLNQMIKMGAQVRLAGRTAIIEGVPRLTGAEVHGTELRASAALLMAAMAAEGDSLVTGFEHADRGYERLEQKFISLGAQIERIED
ncbi:MAG: UDP-N-acetylglucosamine 1-carboxyvinyltransferase [Firmicutes bacterium]|nr:UDP-N-acetylglucosamine 1-carboxyvinyltransferase [Bacillota bacterium]